MQRSRNNTIDLLKLIASYMVVFIHVNFYGTFDYAIDALARFAVPFFFVVSGFYSYEISPDKIKKRIAHIIRLITFATILYTLFKTAPFLLQRDFGGIVHYFGECVKFENLLKFLIFNEPVHATYLWYLFSMLYVYILFYFVTVRKVSEKIIFTISLVLVSAQLILGEGLAIFGFAIPGIFVRNFLLMGLPFFGIGLLANKHQQQLKNAPNKAVTAFLLFGIAETLFSRFVIGFNEIYIGSLSILLALIIISVKFTTTEYPRFIVEISDCSTFIYILHVIVASVMRKFYPIFGINYDNSNIIMMLHPLIVCILSTLASYLLNKIFKKLKIRL